EIVRETAVEHGRDPDKIEIAVEKLTVIDRDHEVAMDRALPTVKTSSKTYERDVDDMSFAIDRHIFGGVEAVKERVGEFVEAGVNHFELKFIYKDLNQLSDQMQLWAEEITPLYR